jgi:hypothetical protein
MNRGGLLERLRILEVELHRLETRKDRSRLEQLLHPDFVEVARSGRRYSRSEVLAEFSTDGAVLETVRAENFELAVLRPGCALLTYCSMHEGPNGELHRRTVRSSLWVETEAGWQMRFHQGTAAEAAPAAQEPLNADALLQSAGIVRTTTPGEP